MARRPSVRTRRVVHHRLRVRYLPLALDAVERVRGDAQRLRDVAQRAAVAWLPIFTNGRCAPHIVLTVCAHGRRFRNAAVDFDQVRRLAVVVDARVRAAAGKRRCDASADWFADTRERQAGRS